MSAVSEANLLGLDYRNVPPRKVTCEIVDIHTHVYDAPNSAAFFEAADLYGIGRIVSMTPLHQVESLRRRHGERLSFIAIPNWKEMSQKDAFRAQWLTDLKAFRALGARLCKFWAAPRLRKEFGLTIDHPWLRAVVDAALDSGFDFMVHVADPTKWFQRADKYAGDVAIYGTKAQQYEQLEWLLERVAPRTVIGAHMGGNVEDLSFLQRLLDRYPHYVLDTSATKWVVRETAWQPQAVHDFIVRNADRILWGSDLVANEKYEGFDHYASRYWTHQMLWETAYRGRSPIADPDADGEPQLAGVDLPADVLERIYLGNARRLKLVG